MIVTIAWLFYYNTCNLFSCPQNESRQLNHQEVVEEDRRKQLPNNWEARKRKAEWILKDEEQRQKALEEGEDYERVKMLNMTVAEAEKFNKKKKNPDVGFSDYQQATARQYNRLVKQMKPDMSKYEEQKKKLGPAFYGDQKTILQGLHSDRPEAVDKMVEDLEKQLVFPPPLLCTWKLALVVKVGAFFPFRLYLLLLHFLVLSV